MCGNSGYDGCRLVTRGSSLPVDGRKEAVRFDLMNIRALGWVNIQNLFEDRSKRESVDRTCSGDEKWGNG